jgi:hypothetical protein
MIGSEESGDTHGAGDGRIYSENERRWPGGRTGDGHSFLRPRSGGTGRVRAHVRRETRDGRG